METNYSADVPVVMERYGSRRKLNYNVRELTEDEINKLWSIEHPDEASTPDEDYVYGHKYAYNSLSLGGAKWTYSGVVDAIIRDKYSVDEMEAITNNLNNVVNEFLLALISFNLGQAIKVIKELRLNDDISVFNEMQSWRVLAKNTAKKIFNQ